jgi:hypothetical protein
MNISLSKIRALPYHERLKFIFLQNNIDLNEIILLLNDYKDWDHEELEKFVIDSHCQIIINKIIHHPSINVNRFYNYFKSTIYVWNHFQNFIWTLLSIDYHNRSHACLLDAIDQLEPSFPTINIISEILHKHLRKEINLTNDEFIIIINKLLSCLKFKQSDLAIKLLKSFPEVKNNPELMRKINDSLMIYDIIV